MDEYWLKQIKDRGFDKNTSLQDFIGFIKDVILSKFSLKTRQAALFYAKQGNIEHSADFLETLTNMVNSANWKNISPEEATCYIFIHSDIDKQICVRFLQKGKSDLQELKDKLKKSKLQPADKDICGICFNVTTIGLS